MTTAQESYTRSKATAVEIDGTRDYVRELLAQQDELIALQAKIAATREESVTALRSASERTLEAIDASLVGGLVSTLEETVGTGRKKATVAMDKHKLSIEYTLSPKTDDGLARLVFTYDRRERTLDVIIQETYKKSEDTYKKILGEKLTALWNEVTGVPIFAGTVMGVMVGIIAAIESHPIAGLGIATAVPVGIGLALPATCAGITYAYRRAKTARAKARATTTVRLSALPSLDEKRRTIVSEYLAELPETVSAAFAQQHGRQKSELETTLAAEEQKLAAIRKTYA